jgi:hypothetical protein
MGTQLGLLSSRGNLRLWLHWQELVAAVVSWWSAYTLCCDFVVQHVCDRAVSSPTTRIAHHCGMVWHERARAMWMMH